MMTRELAKFIAEDLKSKTVAGCQVEGLIAPGGTAVVLAARRDGVPVALKLYSKELVEKDKPKHLERLARQLQLRDHNHPKLVKILDAGECPSTGYLYVVMDRITDPPLSELVPEVPRDRIRGILADIASAALYLHERQLVHRDIKPSNIAVSRTTYSALLMDLGVVRPVVGETITDDTSGQRFLGTRRYSPPEFVRRMEDHTPEAWTAVTFYQLGAVLHDLIMRKRMYDGIENSPHDLDQAILFQMPTIVADDVPQDLVQLARDCLQKDPSLRLRFVTWDRLLKTDDSPEQTASTDDALQRLAARQAMQRTTTPSTALSQQRALEGAVRAIDQALDSSLRSICIESGVFPPLMLTTESDSAHVRIHRASFEYQLAGKQRVFVIVSFRTRILNASSMAVEVELATSISSTEPANAPSDLPFAEVVFKGTFDPGLLHSAIARTLPIAVDQALQYFDTLQNVPDRAELFVPTIRKGDLP